jgi:UDP-N-acetylglucosamine:LPS N-acetylglucosamine transferase
MKHGASRTSRHRRVLAVASGGGHWEQLQLLRQAFDDHDVTWVTTLPGLGERAGLSDVHVVADCNRDEPVRAARTAAKLLFLILTRRPDVVISTGALPGLIALAIGKRLGARTVWVDSIANASEMSLAGAKARPHAALWMSQWPAVAEAAGAEYAGAVL